MTNFQAFDCLSKQQRQLYTTRFSFHQLIHVYMEAAIMHLRSQFLMRFLFYRNVYNNEFAKTYFNCFTFSFLSFLSFLFLSPGHFPWFKKNLPAWPYLGQNFRVGRVTPIQLFFFRPYYKENDIEGTSADPIHSFINNFYQI